MNTVLIVDDDVAICESLKFALKKNYELLFAHDPMEALDCFNKYNVDLILLDLKIGKYDGMELYNILKSYDPNVVVIIMTGYGTIKSSIEAIKQGVYYYITKPIDLNELKIFIEKGINVKNLYDQIDLLNNQLYEKNMVEGIVAASKGMKVVMDMVDKVKDIDANVLITGKSGTGKEVIAKAIHYQGKRKDKRFVAINCAAIPFNLLESELFGYEAGAFTGANKSKKGLFEQAEKGTIFLDEIGEMDILLQSKILRVIQEKEITPVGSNISKKIDVRIICATNKDLAQLVKENLFREDLYYRLNVINIKIPELKDRKEDIPLLIEMFIKKYNSTLNKNIKSVSKQYLNIISNCSFKGNVRELENIVERSMIFCNTDELREEDLPSEYRKERQQNFLSDNIIHFIVGEKLCDIEKKVILQTYRACGKNKYKTAQVLGITDRTIRNKLKKYTEGNDEE